jgi:hypothetical protein
MTTLSHLYAPVSVPYRHKVIAVAPPAPVSLDLNAPLNPYAKTAHTKNANQSAPRGRYSANSAAPGFAAQVLVEAGLTGSDPFAAARGARAYDARPTPVANLRLVA